jgi:predicted O-linked N-acetylglucosamine transferase (SPINDLY family)
VQITVEEEEDLVFLQDVTWSEVNDIVSMSADKTAELMGQCNETHNLLQALDEENLTANYTVMLNESFAAVKQRASETISKVYHHITDLKELFIEFAEYVIALAKQVNYIFYKLFINNLLRF